MMTLAFALMSLSAAAMSFSNFVNLQRIKAFQKEITDLQQELQEARRPR